VGYDETLFYCFSARVFTVSTHPTKLGSLLRSKNTHITVVSTEGMIARELRNATDRYIDLNNVRSYIDKSDF